MNDYNLTLDDLSLTEKSEQCVLNAYPDPASPLAKTLIQQGKWQGVLRGNPIDASLLALSGAPWTIGWGHTGSAVHYGLAWTQAQADTQLLADMASAQTTVRSAVKVSITFNEFVALCDFVFNVGAAAFVGSTLLRKLNSGDTSEAGQEFARWNIAGGIVLRGLVTRRANEAALFATPDAA